MQNKIVVKLKLVFLVITAHCSDLLLICRHLARAGTLGHVGVSGVDIDDEVEEDQDVGPDQVFTKISGIVPESMHQPNPPHLYLWEPSGLNIIIRRDLLALPSR